MTIVTGGADTHKWFIDKIKSKFPDSAWTEIDLRGILHKDPATSIGHKQDWQFGLTQQVVIAQTEFANVIVEAVTIVDGIADLQYSESSKLSFPCSLFGTCSSPFCPGCVHTSHKYLGS